MKINFHKQKLYLPPCGDSTKASYRVCGALSECLDCRACKRDVRRADILKAVLRVKGAIGF